jgi:N6-L-threonylcarbamoyladenine synthase
VPAFITALEKAGLLNQKNRTKNPDLNNILEREPELQKQLILFLEKYEKPNVDLIAVTNGPGLEPCLWVGVNFSKARSYIWNIPIIPVNHIEGHILVNLIDLPAQAGNPEIKFTAIALVVSGGHTQIILVKGIGKYKILGETRDDAAGECFDKCAKILGLGYPGGPIISKLAQGIETKRLLPRPMIGTKDYDFSFSGLKTAVLYADRKVENKNAEYKKQMSAEIQQSIIDVLIKKTIKAVRDFNAKSLILGGGVSANQELKKQFAYKLENETPDIKLFSPKPNLSADNALMVAITAFYHLPTGRQAKKIGWKNISADGNLRISK